MKMGRLDPAVIRSRLRAVLFLAGAVAGLMLPAAFGTSLAAENALSDGDKQCLACHSAEGMEKKLPNGDTLSLHVKGEVFAGSVHRPLGCAGCHADVDLKTHPGSVRNTAANAREHAINRAQLCRQCHEDAYKEHEKSIHAQRLSEGNLIAPLCTGCHGAHDVTPKTAYETCVGCHAQALTDHQKWLPNASRHHEVVSCAACHAPAALRMVDLRLHDRAAKRWLAEKEGAPQFEKLARAADADGKGLDAVELRDLMREINRNGDGNGAPPSKALRGRIELRTNIEAHRLSAKSAAVKGCENCHSNGAEPFQNVTVSITGPDGRPIRYPAHKDVLTSALSIESLPEFYAIGATRSRLLDVLLILAVVGGAGGILGHMTLRWLSRKPLAGNPPGAGERSRPEIRPDVDPDAK